MILSKLKSLAGTSLFKILAITALIGLCVYYKMYSDEQKYNLGYNTATKEMLEANEQALRERQRTYEDSLAVLKGKLQKSQEASHTQRELASELQQKLNNRPTKERIVEITKYTSPDCSDLGSDYNRLSKSIIGEAPIISRK